MNEIELNAILYYADYLSLQNISQPVTDTCKYFFIHGCPINAAYLSNVEPIYDIENPYLNEAYKQFLLIRDRYQEDGVMSFINDICFIRSCGMVDGMRMLQQIHMFSTKQERKQAIRKYKSWQSELQYTHTVTDEDGKQQQIPCTKYFKHAEIARKGQDIP